MQRKWPETIDLQRASAGAILDKSLYAGWQTFAALQATSYAESQTGLERCGNDWFSADNGQRRKMPEGKEKVLLINEYIRCMRVAQAREAAARVGFSAVSGAGFVACTPDGDVVHGIAKGLPNIEEALDASGYVLLAPHDPQAAEITVFLNRLRIF